VTRTPGPPPTFTSQQEQGDDRFYTQWDLVGNFTTKDFDVIPPEWSFQPAVGFAYNLSLLETTADSNGEVAASVGGGETEDFFMLFGRARVERQAFAPWSINPSASIGFTQELVSDLDTLTRDRTYLDVTAGVGVILPENARLDLEYTLRHGLEGVRQNQSFVAALTVSF
jgi:hypothetical protein